MKYYIGIDPGSSGAIACLGSDYKVVWARDIPVTKNKRGSTIIDLDKFRKIFLLVKHLDCVCAIEDVWGQPVQGVKAASSFMFAYGCIITTVKFLHLPIVDIDPNSWKKQVGIKRKKGLTVSQRKELARNLAIERHPEAVKFLKLKGDHNKAEAILIARAVLEMQNVCA